VKAWFIVDFNVVAPLEKEELLTIPHEVYLATRHDNSWMFTLRKGWINKAKQYCSTYRWGGLLTRENVSKGDSAHVEDSEEGVMAEASKLLASRWMADALRQRNGPTSPTCMTRLSILKYGSGEKEMASMPASGLARTSFFRSWVRLVR
ncbi:hypothetical protein BJ878DRAFT_423360, partial [Calycina marina]